MRFLAIVSAALALAIPAFAAPTLLHAIEKYDGLTTGRYIVKLKDGVSVDSVLKQANTKATHSWEVINGFAGDFNPEALDILRALPDVEYISEDGIMKTLATQTNAPWGLARLSSVNRLANQDPRSLSFSYTFGASTGKNVDVFIIDTGVLITHTQFGGRARWGATFGGYPNADGNGHGTHCAGTVAGSQFGVAKEASIIAVKVLSDQGSGSVADIISGMNFVASTASASKRPSIASMSLGGGASTAMDQAVAKLTAQGIHVIVAAGNSNVDAQNTSPARAPSAVTVGASTIADARASFSNFGAVVDIFAPGQDVISSWIGSNTATNMISGTSMATPHVAGLTAYLIGLGGNLPPAAMSQRLKDLGLKGTLAGIPGGTVNLLAHNA